ncbi:LysR family transcriptional regulator [uncultured Faecalibaculum sp.]|uniref:LysR family transcriptional regulator n=3 Tax=uncultured Faecalibaculum sp. TaxID=1729681 RepID=UPI002629B792|nr:LysR family transcriptional regulator [uncultured Faecalibaculum sp.]
MEFRTLVYFMEVAQKKSFTKAAASLHISQPALSKQIRLLEEELHCQLFERFPRQIRLTAQGEAFYEQAIKVNFMKEQLLDQFRNYDGELHGTIKLGVMDQSLLFAGRILAEFLRQHAKVSLELTVLPEEALHDGLARDLFSCVLLTEPCSANDCDYFALPFTRPWGIIATATSLEGKEGIQAEDLQTMNLAVPDRLLVRNLLAGWIGGNERGTRPVMYYTGAQEMYPLAQADSVQILALEPDGLPADLVFRPLVPAVTSRCLVAWNKYRLLSVLEQQFLDAFSQHREEETVTAEAKTSQNGENRPPAVQTV